jgi:hypothetical protein
MPNTPPPPAVPDWSEVLQRMRPLLDPPQAPDELGRLGRYRLLRILGAGGMGCVFAAEDMDLQRCVAVKIMRPAIAAEFDAQERFLHEARAGAALHSPHIVTIHHVGSTKNTLFLVMELLEGLPLSQWHRQCGANMLEEHVRLVADHVLTGLAIAHAKGLIHRDIKPANLWWELPAQRVKILDFGLAHGSTAPHLTQSGYLVGTPTYMSPEQANGQPIDVRSDLFSVGAVLFYLLTGRAPFERGGTMDTLVALALDDAPTPPGTSPGFARFIRRLLAKNPADRPADAEAARQELTLYLSDSVPDTVNITLVDHPRPTLPLVLRPPAEPDAPATPRRANPPAPPMGWWVVPIIVGVLVVVVGWFAWTLALRLPAPDAAPPNVPKPTAPMVAELAFPGTGYVQIPDLPIPTSRAMTVEAWVWPEHADRTQSLFDWRDLHHCLALDYAAGKHGWWASALGPQLPSFAIHTQPLTPPHQWVHVAVVWTGQEPTLYVNGTHLVTLARTYPAVARKKTGLVLGASWEESEQKLRRFFVGRLAEVRISDGVRYTQPFVPVLRHSPDASTLALYRCNEGTGTQLHDESRHGRHGILHGTQWIITPRP